MASLKTCLDPPLLHSLTRASLPVEDNGLASKEKAMAILDWYCTLHEDSNYNLLILVRMLGNSRHQDAQGNQLFYVNARSISVNPESQVGAGGLPETLSLYEWGCHAALH